jgi:hypothetical protein
MRMIRCGGLVLALSVVVACDEADPIAPDGSGAGGKADDLGDSEPQPLDLIAWAEADPKHGRVLGDWAAARLHEDAYAMQAAYDERANLSIVDAARLADDREGIASYYAAERACFEALRLEHLWAFDAPDQRIAAVVERVSGTLNGAPCPLLGHLDPETASGRSIAFHRLVIVQTHADADGRIVKEILAYDEATVPGQITGADNVRAVDDRSDFGDPVVHVARYDEAARHLRELTIDFDAAFGDEDVEGTVAFLDEAACEGPCVTDLTFPVDFDRKAFGGLLTGFYQAFVDVSVSTGDGQGTHGDPRHHVVDTHAGSTWVLDAFQWTATHAPSQQRVQLTDYVLLEYDGDAIVRSITFKNGAALGRQLGG